MLVVSGGIALALGLSPMFTATFNGPGEQRHLAAVASLREARAEAKEHGHERRMAIRERVAEDKARKGREDGEKTDEERLSA